MKLLILCLLACTVQAEDAKKYLTPREIGVIKTNWPDYLYASEKTGVPVSVLPAIHYREAALYKSYFSFKRGELVPNIGGPFMLDFGVSSDPAEFEARIRKYEQRVFELYGGKGKAPKSSDNLRFAILCGAHHLKQKARYGFQTLEGISDAVWGYNGRASWQNGYLHSSYVSSDPKNGVKLNLRYKKRNGEIVEFEDTRPGAMVLYREILDLVQSGHIP